MSAAAWVVPLSDLAVDEELRGAVDEAVASGWWSMGPRVQEFEAAFAEFVGVPHAFAVSSCTAALHLALLGLGCGPGDEVITPSLTFVAAANMIARVGATPVFCDIRGPGDLNLDPADLERCVTGRTKAIVVLHYGGVPCDLAAVQEIATARGIAVVEDAAHAPGASIGGRMCGSVGACGCFSFFSNKNLPVGEGGMIVTAEESLAGKIRLLRSHGMTALTWDRHRGHAAGYDVVEPGLNYRLDEIRAAVGLVQLGRLPRANAARAKHLERYREILDGRLGLSLPLAAAPPGAVSSSHLAVVLLPDGVERDAIRAALAERRIQTSVHYPPIHRFSAYRTRSTRPLPRTDAVADRMLTLPLYPHLSQAQVELVGSSLLETVEAELSRGADAA